MIELYNSLIESALIIIVNFELLQLSTPENLDFIIRCIDKADSIYEAQLWE